MAAPRCAVPGARSHRDCRERHGCHLEAVSRRVSHGRGRHQRKLRHGTGTPEQCVRCAPQDYGAARTVRSRDRTARVSRTAGRPSGSIRSARQRHRALADDAVDRRPAAAGCPAVNAIVLARNAARPNASAGSLRSAERRSRPRPGWSRAAAGLAVAVVRRVVSGFSPAPPVTEIPNRHPTRDRLTEAGDATRTGLQEER